MSPLRQRFIDDLRLRNLVAADNRSLRRASVKLARFAGQSPDQLGPEDIRRFQLDLLDRKASWSQFNQIVVALRCPVASPCSGRMPFPPSRSATSA